MVFRGLAPRYLSFDDTVSSTGMNRDPRSGSPVWNPKAAPAKMLFFLSFSFSYFTSHWNLWKILMNNYSRFIYIVSDSLLCEECPRRLCVTVCAGHKSNVPYGSCFPAEIVLNVFQELFQNSPAGCWVGWRAAEGTDFDTSNVSLSTETYFYDCLVFAFYRRERRNKTLKSFVDLCDVNQKREVKRLSQFFNLKEMCSFGLDSFSTVTAESHVVAHF